QPPGLLVEPARRAEVGEPELAARVLDAVAQHVERPASLDLGGEPPDELLPYCRAVVLLELLPFLGLRGEDEVQHVARQQAERAVVVLGLALAVTAGRGLAVRRRTFPDRRRVARAGVGAILEQPALDRLLEGALGDLGAHVASSRTSILPVTAAEMSAVRSSLRRSMAARILAMSTSIFAVSVSRNWTISCCSSPE